MKTSGNKIRTLAALFAVSMLTVATAKATIVPITYSVAGTTTPLSVGGDTISLGASGQTLVNLDTANPVVSLLNTVDWYITSTDKSGDYTGTISRTMTVSIAVTPNETLTQNVDVSIQKNKNKDKDNQTLTISSTSPLLFNWSGVNGSKYQLTVSPLDLVMVDTDPMSALPEHKYDTIQATLSLAFTPAVPEPSTIFAGALLLIPFASTAVRVIRKNKGQ